VMDVDVHVAAAGRVCVVAGSAIAGVQRAECRAERAECRAERAECRAERAECRAQSAERRVPRGHGLPGDKGGRTHSRGGPSGRAARDRVCVTGRDRVSEVD
jgi:hypothetical protein